jgi:3-hydroxyacyl-CoA dehydrogenase/enoyl-CoA hydratase/3-hydroxybutyryl-CoA epimerase
MKNIALDISEDGIGVARIDMPGRAFNVFSEAMMAELDELIERAATELTGLLICSGKNAFAAGADLAMIKDFANMRFDANWQEMRDRYSYLGKLFRRIERSPVPVVAAVNGLALGGGLELAMACHARVCVDVDAPILGLPEILLGLLPGAGGTQRLPRYVGLEQGIKMILGGTPVTPAQALSMGLIDAVVSLEQLIPTGLEMVKVTPAKARWDTQDWQLPAADSALLASPGWSDYCRKTSGWDKARHQLYPAVESIIRCVGHGADLPIDQGFDVEWDIFVDLMSDPVAANMVVTCFLNKTAASKWASERVTEGATGPGKVAWCSQIALPRGFARKTDLVDEDLAATLIVDELPSSNKPFVLLRKVSDCKQAVINALPNVAVIDYVDDLHAAEVVEITTPPALSKTVVDIVSTMGKIPIWAIAPGGGSRLVLDNLRERLAASGLDDKQLAAAAWAVDATPLFSCALNRPLGDGVSWSSQDRMSGLNILGEVALAACQQSNGRYEELDVLAVLGLGWPKWTGGPVAFLAMLQRGELPVQGVASDLLVALEGLEEPLKIKASYSRPADRRNTVVGAPSSL